MKDDGLRVRTLLGENMRVYRELNRLSQEQLGDRCDSTGQYISEIERGDKWPSPGLLEKIALGLGVGVGRLFGIQETGIEVSRDEAILEYSARLKDEVAVIIDRLRVQFLKNG